MSILAAIEFCHLEARRRRLDPFPTPGPRGGADDPGRAAPAAPDDHRAGCRADPRSQEPLGRLSSRGQGDLPTIRMCGKLFVPTELVLQKIGLRPPVDAEPRAAS